MHIVSENRSLMSTSLVSVLLINDLRNTEREWPADENVTLTCLPFYERSLNVDYLRERPHSRRFVAPLGHTHLLNKVRPRLHFLYS